MKNTVYERGIMKNTIYEGGIMKKQYMREEL